MALIVADRVLETSTTTGNGAYTLAGAIVGYRALSSVCANLDTFTYFAEDVDSFGRPTGDWETGLGTWNSDNTLTRTLIYASSNFGAAISWSAGTRRIGLSVNAYAVLGATTITGNLTAANYSGTSSGTNTGDETNTTLSSKLQIITKTYAINIPSGVNDAIEFAAVTNSNFSSNVELWLTIHDSGYAQSKRYIVPVQYDGTAGAWHKLLPISSTGIFYGNDTDIDVSISAQIATFRVRRISGGVAGVARISLSIGGDPIWTTVTSVSTTYTSQTVTNTYAPTSLTMINGKTGINTDTPTEALDVTGNIRASGVIMSSNLSGYNTGDQDLSGKQDVLVSGTNIKTINGSSILGSGGITIGGIGSGLDADLLDGQDGTYYATSESNLGKTRMSGFPVDNSSNFLVMLLYDETTRTLTVTPTGTTFDFYVDGVRYTKTGVQSIVHSALQGLHFIYYNTVGTLVTSQTPWDLSQTAPVSAIFYDATNTFGICMYETHHAGRDVFMHQRLHAIDGTQTVSGFEVAGYTLNTDSDVAITYSIASGILADEDLRTTTDALADTGPYTILYRSGAAGDWRITKTNTIPVLQTTNILQYNQFTGGAWQLTNVTNTNFVNYWVFAVPALTGSGNQIIIVPGQSIFTTLAAAQAQSVSSISWGSMPFAEIAPLYQVTMTYRTTYAGTAKSRISSITRVIGTRASITATAQTNHGSLTGLTDANSHPATAISFSPIGDIIATDVQAAIVELDTEKYSTTNPAGYTTNTGTVTSVSGTGTVSGLTLSGTVSTTGNITLGGTLAVDAAAITGTITTDHLGTGTANSTTYLRGDSTWQTISGGASVTNDTTTNSNAYYPTLSTITTGTLATAYTSSTKMYFNPSTGTLSSTIFNSLSDERAKTNIRVINNAADIINSMSGYSFDWKDGSGSSYGVIAQEVEKVLPNAVTDTDDKKSVNYSALIPVLIESIKQLHKQVNELQIRLNNKT